MVVLPAGADKAWLGLGKAGLASLSKVGGGSQGLISRRELPSSDGWVDTPLASIQGVLEVRIP